MLIKVYDKWMKWVSCLLLLSLMLSVGQWSFCRLIVGVKCFAYRCFSWLLNKKNRYFHCLNLLFVSCELLRSLLILYALRWEVWVPCFDCVLFSLCVASHFPRLSTIITHCSVCLVCVPLPLVFSPWITGVRGVLLGMCKRGREGWLERVVESSHCCSLNKDLAPASSRPILLQVCTGLVQQYLPEC